MPVLGAYFAQDVYWMGTKNRISICLILGAGVLGFCHGIKLANWQVAVEGAQVLAGLVGYPESSPQGVYHRKLWTLLNQASALALLLGVPERSLSIVLSGLGGSAFYVGITLISYAASRNVIVSLIMPLMVLWTGAAGAAGGITYPVILLNSPHTYGSFGLSVVVIGVGLIGCGYLRAAAVVIGVAPSLHPSWGMWINLVAIVTFAFNGRLIRIGLKEILPWLMIGYLVTGTSLLFWFYQSSGIESQIADYTSRYVSAFAGQWDAHRRPLTLSDIDFRTGWNFHTVVLLSMICCVWLMISWRKHYPSKNILFMMLFVSSVGAVAASGIVSLAGAVSDPLRVLMPQRWLNLSIVCFIPILIGTLGWEKKTGRGWSILLMLVAVVLFKYGRGLPLVSHWFVVFMIIYFMFMYQVAMHRENIENKIWALTTGVFLIPFLLLFSSFLNMFSGSSVYFWNSIFVLTGTIVCALVLAQVTGNFRYPRRWVLYSAMCLLIVGINLMITSSPEFGKGNELITEGILYATLLIVFGVGICVMRNKILENGVRLCTGVTEIIDLTSACQLPSMKSAVGRKLEGYIAIGLVLIGCLYFLTRAFSDPAWAREEFKDRTNSAFWAQVEAGDGLLLTGSDLYLVQLKSRRPVLLDGGALNWLPYVPEGAPAVERILLDVYGINEFQSSVGARGRLEPESGKGLWTQRSQSEWQQLRMQFNVTDVIVYDEWELGLPLVKKGFGYSLYHIP